MDMEEGAMEALMADDPEALKQKAIDRQKELRDRYVN